MNVVVLYFSPYDKLLCLFTNCKVMNKIISLYIVLTRPPLKFYTNVCTVRQYLTIENQ